MFFDFDDRYSDIEPVGSAINRRDGVAVSVLVHAAIVVALMFVPQYLQQYLPARPVPPPPQEQARREADVIVQEASAEGRRLVRDGIAEKEQLLAETHRIPVMLRAALEIVSDGVPHADDDEDADQADDAVGPPGIQRLAG